MTDQPITDADKAVEEAIRARIRAGNAEAVRCLHNLVTWVPEMGFPDFKGVYGDPPGDDCPFVTESYLYELLGKEDARTILAYLNHLARSLGTTLWDLQLEEAPDEQ